MSASLRRPSRRATDGALTFAQEIPMGHKAALVDLKPGDVVVKYGFPIGRVTAPIRAGEHVHSHNMATGLGEDTALVYTPHELPAITPGEVPTFEG